jgi:hypothetical protein
MVLKNNILEFQVDCSVADVAELWIDATKKHVLDT